LIVEGGKLGGSGVIELEGGVIELEGGGGVELEGGGEVDLGGDSSIGVLLFGLFIVNITFKFFI